MTATATAQLSECTTTNKMHNCSQTTFEICIFFYWFDIIDHSRSAIEGAHVYGTIISFVVTIFFLQSYQQCKLDIVNS